MQNADSTIVDNLWKKRIEKLSIEQKIDLNTWYGAYMFIDPTSSQSKHLRVPMDENKAKQEAKGQEEVMGLDDEVNEDEEKLLLKSGDSGCKGYPIQKKTAMLSNLVKTVLDQDPSSKEVPLPNVKGAILKKVIAYMEYHVTKPAKEIKKPLNSSEMIDVVEAWDADFVNVSQDILFELILAANYMDIKSLLDLTCAKVANMMKGKSPEQIRKLFNLTNDFSPEEEEAVREENKQEKDISPHQPGPDPDSEPEPLIVPLPDVSVACSEPLIVPLSDAPIAGSDNPPMSSSKEISEEPSGSYGTLKFEFNDKASKMKSFRKKAPMGPLGIIAGFIPKERTSPVEDLNISTLTIKTSG